MFPKHAPIEIPRIDLDSTDGFVNPFENDCLERALDIGYLTLLAERTPHAVVLAVNGRWGSGKTSFLKMWQSYCELRPNQRRELDEMSEAQLKCVDEAKNLALPTVYFNAWENDFLEDPLIAVLQAFRKQVLNFVPEEDQKRAEFRKAFRKALRKAGPLIIKLALRKLLDVESAREIMELYEREDAEKSEDKIGEEIAKFGEKFAAEVIDRQEDASLSLGAFRSELNTLVDAVVSGMDNRKAPIVFFVDELDRCRPTYAIQLLERIKHIFTVQGFVFVLGMDREQLCHSIRAIYGTEFDADGYLRRFFDHEYSLPTGGGLKFIENLTRRSAAFIRPLHSDNGGFAQEYQYMAKLLARGRMGARDHEQILSHISVIRPLLDSSAYDIPLVFLVILKHLNRQLYADFVKGSASPASILPWQIIPFGRHTGYPEAYFIRSLSGFIYSYLLNEEEWQGHLDDWRNSEDVRMKNHRRENLDYLRDAYLHFSDKSTHVEVPRLARLVDFSSKVSAHYAE